MKTAADFANKSEFFAYLVKNKKEIISMKKSAIKHTLSFDMANTSALKSLATDYKDDIASGVIKRTIIGNTYNWMDKANDVLLPGCFSKSINERKNSIWHLHDHEMKTTSKVGQPLDIYEKAANWKDLGIDIVGKTECLFMDSEIMKEYNSVIFYDYSKGLINQHSVAMNYIKLDLAVNDASQKEEFAVWSKYINQIGNKEEAIKDGFFWAILEGKLVEISCVLAGCNELTPTVENKPKSAIQNTDMCCNDGCDSTEDICTDCGMCVDCCKCKKSAGFDIDKLILSQKKNEFNVDSYIESLSAKK